MNRLTARIILISSATLLLLLGITGAVAWKHRQAILIAASQWIDARILRGDSSAIAPKPDAASYEVLCNQLEEWRSELSARYEKAATAEAKAGIENEARIILEYMLPAMMRCWIGTKWDFNGTAAKPGQGKIACGYFVSTVLRDAGLDVNRYRLAQQPSANIIHTFLDAKHCTLAVGQNYEVFTEGMKELPHGVYICGLDTHVAFIVNHEGGFRFIHSSGSKPWAVVDESAKEAEVLKRSNWRMLGNLTANPEFIRTWLRGKPIKVVSN